MSATAMSEQMTQLNMRVNAQDKRKAEDVLRLMGTTATQITRKILAKIARGAKDYAEIAAVLEDTPATEEQEKKPSINPALFEGWAIGDRYMQMLGYESMADVPRDDRPWDEIYEEAMMEKALEKGWLS